MLCNLTEFRAEAGIWARDSVKNAWRNVTPSVWWRGVCGDEPLCPIALRLLSVPGSSIAAERNWSLYARTHTKWRNRLLNKKTEKLVAVQMNSKYSLPPGMIKKQRKCPKSGVTFPRATQEREDEDEDLLLVDADSEVTFPIDTNTIPPNFQFLRNNLGYFVSCYRRTTLTPSPT